MFSFQICSILLTTTCHHGKIQQNLKTFPLGNMKVATLPINDRLTCEYQIQLFFFHLQEPLQSYQVSAILKEHVPLTF